MFSPSRFFSTDPLHSEQAFPLGLCTSPWGLHAWEHNAVCWTTTHKVNTTHQASCASRRGGAGWRVFVKLFYVDECKISVHLKD